MCAWAVCYSITLRFEKDIIHRDALFAAKQFSCFAHGPDHCFFVRINNFFLPEVKATAVALPLNIGRGDYDLAPVVPDCVFRFVNSAFAIDPCRPHLSLLCPGWGVVIAADRIDAENYSCSPA